MSIKGKTPIRPRDENEWMAFFFFSVHADVDANADADVVCLHPDGAMGKPGKLQLGAR